MWLGNHFLSNFKQNLRFILQQSQSIAEQTTIEAILSKICPDKLDLDGELGDSLSAIAKAILERKMQKD